MRKSGLALERHWVIGAELKAMSNRLSALSIEVGNAYPVTGDKGRAHIRLCRARKEIDCARVVLEDLLYAEHRGEASIDVYYGNSEAEP